MSKGYQQSKFEITLHICSPTFTAFLAMLYYLSFNSFVFLDFRDIGPQK